MEIDPAPIAVFYVVLLLLRRGGRVKDLVQRLGMHIAKHQVQMLADGNIAIRQHHKAIQYAVTIQFKVPFSPVVIKQ